jgi:hypothetical protein
MAEMAYILLFCAFIIPLMGIGVILDYWVMQLGDGN